MNFYWDPKSCSLSKSTKLPRQSRSATPTKVKCNFMGLIAGMCHLTARRWHPILLQKTPTDMLMNGQKTYAPARQALCWSPLRHQKSNEEKREHTFSSDICKQAWTFNKFHLLEGQLLQLTATDRRNKAAQDAIPAGVTIQLRSDSGRKAARIPAKLRKPKFGPFFTVMDLLPLTTPSTTRCTVNWATWQQAWSCKTIHSRNAAVFNSLLGNHELGFSFSHYSLLQKLFFQCFPLRFWHRTSKYM